MRLENEPQSGQQPSTVRMSASELDAVLNRAIARDSQGKNLEPREATLEDAVEIARELGISEAQVRASLEEVRAEKRKSARREEKREIVRLRRRGAQRLATVGAVLMSIAVGALSFYGAIPPLFLAAPILGWLLTGWLAYRARFLPISDQEADSVELTPAAGVCRLCGQPAYTPQASFCEEHRYKGPRK